MSTSLESAMPQPQERPFRLTLRRQMIVVAYFAVIFAAISPLTRQPSPQMPQAVLRLALLLTPWVFAALIGLFDRPGPFRSWAVVCCLYLFYPALAVYLDISVGITLASTGEYPRLWAIVAFNLLIGGSTYLFCKRMAPCRCPSCTSRSMIPLVRLTGQSERLDHTRYCGYCGGLFWRDATGNWRRERRVTWVHAKRAEKAPPVALLDPALSSNPQVLTVPR